MKAKELVGYSVTLNVEASNGKRTFEAGTRLCVQRDWRGKLLLVEYAGCADDDKLKWIAPEDVTIWRPEIGQRFWHNPNEDFCEIVELESRGPGWHRAKFDAGSESGVHDQELSQTDGKAEASLPPDSLSLPVYKSEALPWLIATKQRFKLTIGSPPYAYKGRRYDQTGELRGPIWEPRRWAYWMADITYWACRRTDGFVCWVVDSPVHKGEYHPAVELLSSVVYLLYGSAVKCERPVVWNKKTAPSRHNSKTGGQDWFSHDYELVLPFFRRDLEPRPVMDNWEAIAKPPVAKPGGAFRQRGQTGKRNEGKPVKELKLARPRDVRLCRVGGGHMGSDLASKGEAPFPESLVEDFVLPLTSEGETVLDPFMGSGTTAAVCERHSRQWVGLDIRQSQIDLTAERIEEVKGVVCGR